MDMGGMFGGGGFAKSRQRRGIIPILKTGEKKREIFKL